MTGRSCTLLIVEGTSTARSLHGDPAFRAEATVSPAGSGLGTYRPCRRQASPLFRLFDRFAAVYDERFAPVYGDWRKVVREVVEKFLACGILEHGFARIRSPRECEPPAWPTPARRSPVSDETDSIIWGEV